jgi:DNA-binding NarL/FixJ family response regulator
MGHPTGGGVTRARIVLADDHREMRNLVTHILGQEFEIVQAVADGPALLAAAAKYNPDLCLIDISMPIINGIEVAARLKKSATRAKIIILTVHEDLDFVKAAFDAGASGYVVKSRMATDLCRAAREVLSGNTFISASVEDGKPVG